MRGFYKHKLIIWGASVALVFLLLWELDNELQGPFDPYILLLIGLTKQIIVLMMVAFTRQWTWRAIGVMSVMQGVAVMYLGASLLYWNPSLTDRWHEPVADLARSVFIVGIVPLLIGVLSYAWVVTSMGIKRRGYNLEEEESWGIPAGADELGRGKKLDAREDSLDERADALDKRGRDMSKEAIRMEHQSSQIEDRENNLTLREQE